MPTMGTTKVIMVGFIIIIMIMLCRKRDSFNDGGTVVELDPSNFDKIVHGDYIVFVKFFANWCGYCKKIEGPWKDLAKEYNGDSKVTIAEVDADQHKELGKKHGVQGFPTIVLFKGGKNIGKYEGGRDVPSWKAHINKVKN